MRRLGSIRLAPALASALAIAAGLGPAAARAQAQPGAPPPVVSTPSPAPALTPTLAPGTAVVGGPDAGASRVAGPTIPPDVQIVRFQGPAGVRVDVLGPNPEPVPTGDGQGLLTVGMKVGTPYRLRVTNIPNRPEVELYPVIEVVGHLHRPPNVDAGKYPIRVALGTLDFEDVALRGRLVTQVVYLEDPEQALPISLPKDEIPVVNLNASEEPLRVAAALGRVMAIVRMGGRRPTAEDAGFGAYGVVGPGAGGPCPFTCNDAQGTRCPVPCGPVCGTPPAPARTWLPKDEYLCDGGDHGEALHFSGDGGLAGIDPRDAVIRFDDGRRPRVLPTNTVCVYAPRFAEVRTSVGPNEALTVLSSVAAKALEKQALEAGLVGPKRMTQNQGLESARHRDRPSGLASRTRAGVHSDLNVVSEYDNSAHLAGKNTAEGAEIARTRMKAAGMKERVRFQGIKTAESAVITGITEGAGEAVMAWVPRETVGVESPPQRPGLAVIKRVSAGEAEAGDTLTFVIQYRNMGNTPIRDVTVVDSLLPRLGYVKGSAEGPKGTAFSADENRVGSTELKWVLPAPVGPGVEGHVSFRAVVR